MPRFRALGVIRSGIDPSRPVLVQPMTTTAPDATVACTELLARLRAHPRYDERIDPAASVTALEACSDDDPTPEGADSGPS